MPLETVHFLINIYFLQLQNQFLLKPCRISIKVQVRQTGVQFFPQSGTYLRQTGACLHHQFAHIIAALQQNSLDLFALSLTTQQQFIQCLLQQHQRRLHQRAGIHRFLTHHTGPAQYFQWIQRY